MPAERTTRHCNRCASRTLHDVRKKHSTAEQLFIGTFTLGLIPALEALDKDDPDRGGDFYTRVAECQRCGAETEL